MGGQIVEELMRMVMINEPLTDDVRQQVEGGLGASPEAALLSAYEHLKAKEAEKAAQLLSPFTQDPDFVKDHPLGSSFIVLSAHAHLRLEALGEARLLIEALRASSRHLSELEQVAVPRLLGTIGMRENRPAEAYGPLTQAHQKAAELRANREYATITLDLAHVAVASGDYVKAVTWLQQALLIMDGMEDADEEIVKARVNLASLYIRLGRSAEAKSEYLNLVKLPLVVGDPVFLLPVHLNLAITYKRLGEYDNSLETYQDTLSLAERYNNPAFVVRALIGIADLNVIIKRPHDAREPIEQAYSLARELEMSDLLAVIEAHRANISKQLGDVDDALERVRIAYEAVKADDNISDAMHFGLDLASWLAEAGRFEEAYNMQRECYELQRKIDEKELERTLELSDLRSKLDRERATIRSRDEERNKVLTSMMPGNIAQRLMKGEQRIADHIENVTVLFADIVGFTKLASGTIADDLVIMLEEIFSIMDEISLAHGCQRVKTIGDAYMAICGASEPYPDHTQRIVRAALGFLNTSRSPLTTVQLRIGVNSGPVVAGVMRGARIAYDVWGDTVNVASRMEENSQPGRILVTHHVAKVLARDPEFDLEQREPLDVRGKGLMTTFWVQASR